MRPADEGAGDQAARLARRQARRRIARHVEALVENEAVRDNLDDRQAGLLLRWAEAVIEAADAVESAGDAAAEAYLARRAANAAQAVRQINALFGAKRQGVGARRAAFLINRLLGRLRVVQPDRVDEALLAQAATAATQFDVLSEEQLFSQLLNLLQADGTEPAATAVDE